MTVKICKYSAKDIAREIIIYSNMINSDKESYEEVKERMIE